jgi:hypothetical protein
VSNWTHRICEECWIKRNPERDPVAHRDAYDGTCCVCGVLAPAPAIFFPADPKSLKCKGEGPEHEDSEP